MSSAELLELSKSLFTKLNAMPYFRNYAAASGAPNGPSKHEDAVENVFKNHRLTRWEPPDNITKAGKITKGKITKAVYKTWIDTPSSASQMPPMTYIVQPSGTQYKPDFIVKLAENVVLAIECKSSKKKAPLYNSGGITSNYIYIFCSKSENKTTIYLGKDIVSDEEQNIINEGIKKMHEVMKETMAKLKKANSKNRGVSVSARPAISQSGPAIFTDYFAHEKKKECEENVHRFVEDMINASTR